MHRQRQQDPSQQPPDPRPPTGKSVPPDRPTSFFVEDLTLAATASAGFWARRAAAVALGRWGVTEPDVREATGIVTAELVANAATASADFADPVIRFRMTTDPARSRVLVAVWDRSMAVPVQRPVDLTATRGRGLLMVAGYSRRWGWYRAAHSARIGPWPEPSPEQAELMCPGPYGKVVWADVPVAPAAP
ncbi:ATP-binding protein [Actinomadura atramentaria]|uniref:ATP-binding protein n=1 Tax=Actinomadura atramentaria TaxID=1990 RepID=UPI00035C8B18|nr:ATP-binding protein [Actinomadura atramentaria]